MSALIRLTRSWLSRPASYAVLAPLVTIAGAATTIAAPILLEPASFSSFILLMSVFQYIADFDLGLARLVDRTFSKPCIDMTGRLRAVGLARALVAATMLAAVLIAAVISCSAPTALAGVAGVAFMLSNGPLAYYRATQDILAFTLTALLMQIGLSLPRLLGLLTGGVTGCMVALAAWYFMTAVVLNIPFAYVPTGRRTAPLWPLFADAFPLCIFSALWLLYLLSNRWVSFTVSSPIDAGLFGFGANLVVIGVGVFGLVAQAYYPRHLAEIDQVSLYRELSHLLVLITGGALVSVLFCRFGLQYIFPHFAGAASSSAVVLISGIPLCLCAWLIPLVIASSEGRGGKPRSCSVWRCSHSMA
jgi:O-antigen/teichoic acid export membrane protein